jgi:hypothetical protein
MAKKSVNDPGSLGWTDDGNGFWSWSGDGDGSDCAGMVVSATEPTDPIEGMQWLNSDTAEVFIFDGAVWLEFPAGSGGSGGSSLWEQNGDDIYYSDGNVGVGMPPVDGNDRLQVSGSISANRNSNGNQRISIASDTVGHNITARGDNKALVVENLDDTSGAISFRHGSASTPSLDLLGNLNAIFSGNATFSQSIYLQDQKARLFWNDTVDETRLFSDGGFILRTGGNLEANNAISVDAAGDATFSGQVRLGASTRMNSTAATSIYETDVATSSDFVNLGAGVFKFRIGGYDNTNNVMTLNANNATFAGGVRGVDGVFSGNIKVDSTHSAARMLYLNATTNNTATYRQALGVQHSGTDMLSIATGPVVSISSKANQLKLENDGGSLVINNNGDATFSGTVSIGRPDPGIAKLRIKGTGNTGNTWGLAVENSDGTSSLYVRDDGNAYFRGKVDAPTFTVNGSPLTRTVDLIKTLSTLRQATMDETQDIRESLRSAIDELVEGFEQEIATMPAGDSE